ncbi:MAG: response regulator [Candidatus Binataceae bacterium]|jgi:two-component system chemotaxis response regulator CheY
MAIRVLIADDSVSIRELLRWQLERVGYEVVGEAECASELVSLFRLLKPDVVTLDLVMPDKGDMDALTAFRIIRKEAPRVPIMVLSAVPFTKTRDLFMEEGAFEYVVKPFGRNLKDALRKLERAFPDLRPQGLLGRVRKAY